MDYSSYIITEPEAREAFIKAVLEAQGLAEGIYSKKPPSTLAVGSTHHFHRRVFLSRLTYS
jgi:hypothetical protein